MNTESGFYGSALVPILVFLITGLASEASLVGQAVGPSFVGPPVGTTVQLPEITFFQLNTAVSVPDGGSLVLGGVNSAASGQRTSGLFPASRYAGHSHAGGSISVHATIISNREIDEYLTAEGERLAAIRAATDPNGSAKVQQKADFLSRHMGGK